MTNPTHHLRATDPARYFAVHVTCVLTAEDRPEDELWLCSNLAAAELIDALRAAGVHVRLYECQLDGDSGDELAPFERVPEYVS